MTAKLGGMSGSPHEQIGWCQRRSGRYQLVVYLPWTNTGLSTEFSKRFYNCGERFGSFISFMFVFADDEEKIWLEEAK